MKHGIKAEQVVGIELEKLVQLFSANDAEDYLIVVLKLILQTYIDEGKEDSVHMIQRIYNENDITKLCLSKFNNDV